MKLYNLKDHNEQVSFAQAVTQGLGKQQGLFFPLDLPEFNLTDIDELLTQDFVTRSAKILSAFIGDEIPEAELAARIATAFTFPAPVNKVQEDVGCLELFHGPTLAFKDFGGRFMAQMLTHIAGDKPVTILTATSGDTGAAVAHAFYGLPNVKVVILYPRGLMSRYIIENRLSKPEQLTGFNSEGYFFDAESSSAEELVFKRHEQ